MKWWSEANDREPNHKVGMYLGVYCMICVLAVLGTCGTAGFAFLSMISRSSSRLHNALVEATFGARYTVLNTIDSGELLNRYVAKATGQTDMFSFSKDMELIDLELPLIMVNYASSKCVPPVNEANNLAAVMCLVKLVILAVFSRYLGISIPFIAAVLYILQQFYLKTSRQVRLLGIEAQAPLYTAFTETAQGAATIRSFRWQAEYQRRAYHLIDTSQRPEYLQSCIQKWLGFVLSLIVGTLAVILVGTAVALRESFSSGSVGVALVQIVGFGEVLSRLITSWTGLESSIGAVARVKRFIEETGAERTGDSVAETWPHTGEIRFEQVVASYKYVYAPFGQSC